MKNRPYRPSLFGPLVLIGLGILLLLQNLNLLPPGMWGALVPLWPVLLVVLGLDMLLGRRSWAGAVLVVLVGALVVAAALTWAALRASALPGGLTETLIQTPLSAQSASVKLDMGVGELSLSALGPSLSLMEGQVVHSGGDDVWQTYAVRDGVGRLELAQRRNALLAPFLTQRDAATAHWDIQLTPALPLALDIQTGVGTARLDLSGLNLTEVNLKTGLGQTEVIFSAGGPLRAKIQAGLGDVTLILPSDLPARLMVTSGLASVHIPARFAQAGKAYTTAGFAPTGPYLDLELTAALGSVTVK